MLAALWYIYAADIWSAAGFDGLNGTTADGVRAALSLEISSQHLSLEQHTPFSLRPRADITRLLICAEIRRPQTTPLVIYIQLGGKKTAAHASDFPQAHRVKDECVMRDWLWAWVNEGFWF
jgi:hypothetical protein